MPLTALSLLLVTAAATAQIAQPYTPQSDSVVLQEVPSSTDPRVKQFEVLRNQLQAQPHNLKISQQLSRAYINYGRETGDARYLGRALALIEPWLQQPAPPASVLLLQATILQSRHVFTQARVILEGLVKANPDNGQAWLTLASVQQVQGDLDAARHSCARLMGGMDALVAASCIGGLNIVSGRAQSGYDVIQLLLSQESDKAFVLRAWAEGLLADASRYLGNDKQADAHYQAALQLAPGDNFLLADYGDFLLDQNRPQAVIDLMQPYRQSDTSFLRLVLAEARLKLPQADADIQEMAQRFRDLELRGDTTLYAREQARFVLVLQHDPARALKIAEQDWTIQRAPEDIRIYLETALASDTPEAAQPALDLLEQTKLEYPRVRALAAAVRQAIARRAVVKAPPVSP
jgi:tetratricopeptide (TPR) repeat protein